MSINATAPASQIDLAHPLFQFRGHTSVLGPHAISIEGNLVKKSGLTLLDHVSSYVARALRYVAYARVGRDIAVHLRVLNVNGTPVLDPYSNRPVEHHTTTGFDGSLCTSLPCYHLAAGPYIVEIATEQPERRALARLPFNLPAITRQQRISIFDIDNTLVQTDTWSCRGLLKAALRRAGDMQPVPAMPALARALGTQGPTLAVSGSPQTLEGEVQDFARIHGIDFDGGIVLKNYLANATHLRDQLGYKLEEILYRLSHPALGHVEFTMAGDNTESDYQVYALLSRYFRGKIRSSEIMDILVEKNVSQHVRQRIAALLRDMPPATHWPRSILIRVHPQNGPRAHELSSNYPEVDFISDGLQGVLILVHRGELPVTAIAPAIYELWSESGQAETAASIADAVTRQLADPSILALAQRQFNNFMRSQMGQA